MFYEVKLFPDLGNLSNQYDDSLTIRMADDIYELKAQYGFRRPLHIKIGEKLAQFYENYKNLIRIFADLEEFFSAIPDQYQQELSADLRPYWLNGFFPPSDAMALCGVLYKYRPRVYLEIGSGNSTKFARKFISDFKLGTEIISIDPEPRSKIDKLCDQVIRMPLEMVQYHYFEDLQEDDILFIDSSHRCLQNSDVTCIFLDILPRLRPGVMVHFHDVWWPEDYNDAWAGRLYNEQYLLGILLLFGKGYEILYSSNYVTLDPELSKEYEGVSRFLSNVGRAKRGGSIWMKL